MDEQNQLYLMLGRIEAKLDSTLQRQDRNDAQVEALDKRVSALERNRAWIIGAATALSALIGTIIPYLKDLFLK